MLTLEKLIYTKKTYREIVWIFVIILSFNFFYFDILDLFYKIFAPQYIPTGDIVNEAMTNELSKYGAMVFILITLGYVVWEELLFRFPLSLLLWAKFKAKFILLGVMILTCGFIWIHLGNSQDVKYLFPILLQGVGGILISILFILSGANNGKYFQAFAVVVLYHFIWNMSTLIYYI